MRLSAVTSLAATGWFVLCISASAYAQNLDEQVDALAEQAIASDPDYHGEGFLRLSDTTKGVVRAIDKSRVAILLYKRLVDEVKHEPSLTNEQVRWLVEIEDLFMSASGSFTSARAMLIMSDKAFFEGENERTRALQSQALSQGVKAFDEAKKKLGKAKRDFATLRVRVEVQKK